MSNTERKFKLEFSMETDSFQKEPDLEVIYVLEQLIKQANRSCLDLQSNLKVPVKNSAGETIGFYKANFKFD